MPTLKCFMENGRFNYELLASCLELRNRQQDEKHSQLMGLAIVVQFMSKQVSRQSFETRLTRIEMNGPNGRNKEQVESGIERDLSKRQGLAMFQLVRQIL